MLCTIRHYIASTEGIIGLPRRLLPVMHVGYNIIRYDDAFLFAN